MSPKNMLSLNPDTVIVAVENQRASMLNDELVVLNLDNEEYYVLNETATAIWSHLQQPIRWENLIANLPDSERDELKLFLLDLASAGLIIETNDSATAREVSLSLSANPTLTCMGGMKELVAMAGSAGGNESESENLDPATEGIEDAMGMFTNNFPADSVEVLRERVNDYGVGDDESGRPED